MPVVLGIPYSEPEREPPRRGDVTCWAPPWRWRSLAPARRGRPSSARFWTASGEASSRRRSARERLRDADREARLAAPRPTARPASAASARQVSIASVWILRAATAVRVTYNRGVLNVSSSGRTEVLDVGSAVQRAPSTTSQARVPRRTSSATSLSRVGERGDRYSLQLLPVSGRIAGRVRRRGRGARKGRLPAAAASRSRARAVSTALRDPGEQPRRAAGRTPVRSVSALTWTTR